MAEIEIKNTALKLVFIIHLILVAWGSQGYWSSDSYIFVNLIFMGILVWGMHSFDNPEPIQLAVAVNVVAIVLDLILVSIRYPAGTNKVSDRFSAWMAILNMIARPFTTIVLWKIYEERNGNRSDGAYEDLDRAVITTSPTTTDITGGYKSSTGKV
ncbi:type-1 angiotensin II receptor-associated protein-like [Chrysoperla carnea]|uniref:type-1 angiotensin II receptor-associated protein-like n=1 Tax=Chrysoperla carnea TaxID=189513 RepID=UPI001D079E9E|nr:type-1 angiotensin II receptor-associated protein-like [Chrysoperla carnea]